MDTNIVITNDEECQARILELEAFSFAEDVTRQEEAHIQLLTSLIVAYEQRYDEIENIQLRILFPDPEWF
jgi:hypothetical protein